MLIEAIVLAGGLGPSPKHCETYTKVHGSNSWQALPFMYIRLFIKSKYYENFTVYQI